MLETLTQTEDRLDILNELIDFDAFKQVCIELQTNLGTVFSQTSGVTRYGGL